MKSIVLRVVLALAALSVVPNALAADSDGGKVFFDARIGDTVGANAGYLWTLSETGAVGLEAGYMDFGQIADNSAPLEFFSQQISATGTTVGGHIQHLFGEDEGWVFQFRAGLLSAKFDEKHSDSSPGGPVTQGSSSSSQSGTYFGFGVGRNVTPGFSLGLAFDRYDARDHEAALGKNWFGFVAEFRF